MTLNEAKIETEAAHRHDDELRYQPISEPERAKFAAEGFVLVRNALNRGCGSEPVMPSIGSI